VFLNTLKPKSDLPQAFTGTSLDPVYKLNALSHATLSSTLVSAEKWLAQTRGLLSAIGARTDGDDPI